MSCVYRYRAHCFVRCVVAINLRIGKGAPLLLTDQVLVPKAEGRAQGLLICRDSFVCLWMGSSYAVCFCLLPNERFIMIWYCTNWEYSCSNSSTFSVVCAENYPPTISILLEVFYNDYWNGRYLQMVSPFPLPVDVDIHHVLYPSKTQWHIHVCVKDEVTHLNSPFSHYKWASATGFSKQA